MIEKEVEIKTADGTADGYLYQPAADGRWPGVIQYPDIIGIRPANRGMARRLSEKGYVVLLPNPFYRSGRAPLFDFVPNFTEPRTIERFKELAGPLTPEVMERDGSSYVDFLSRQSSVGGPTMAVIGYCFTGAMALRTAAARPDKIGAVASFHGGGLFTDAPHSPHTILPRVQAQLLFAHAVEDNSMPQEAIEKLESALQAWGGKYDSETFAGARHGWTVPGTPVYNEAQADRAFEKLVLLLGAARP
jgi:carboxymethylenebutenolidase